MKKTALRFGIIFLLTAVFLFFFFRSVDWKEVLGYLTGVDLKFFIILIALTPLHLILRAVRWQVLLKHEKQGVSFYNRFAGNAVGFTVTFIFPGRLGELVRPLYLAQKEGMKKGFVFGTIVVERIFDLFTMCFLLGLFILSKPLYAPIFKIDEEAYSRLSFWGIIGVSLAFFLLLFTLSLYFFRKRTLSVIGFFLKPFSHRFSERVLRIFEEFIEGLKFFHSFSGLMVYILLSCVVWLGIIFFYWIFFFSYNISVPYFLIVPYVFLTMVGASIPTPGMVGGFHYFSKLGLISMYAVDVNLAVGMTIVVHAVQILMTCLIGYAILWREGISLFQAKRMGEKAEP